MAITPAIKQQWDRFSEEVGGNVDFLSESAYHIENVYTITNTNASIKLIWSSLPDTVTQRTVARTEFRISLKGSHQILKVCPNDFFVRMATLFAKKCRPSDQEIAKRFIFICNDCGFVEAISVDVSDIKKQLDANLFFIEIMDINEDEPVLLLQINSLLADTLILSSVYEAFKRIAAKAY